MQLDLLKRKDPSPRFALLTDPLPQKGEGLAFTTFDSLPDALDLSAEFWVGLG